MFDKIHVSSLAVTLGAALLAASALPQLRASEFDKKTIVNFSTPAQIIGQVLPAGTYVFKTLGGVDNDDVMVTNQDESHSAPSSSRP